MHKYELAVLNALKDSKSSSLEGILKKSGIGRDETLWALENLSARKLVSIERRQSTVAELTEEGSRYLREGLPEELLLRSLKKSGVSVSELSGVSERIGLQWSKRNGFIAISDGIVGITSKGKEALKSGITEAMVLHEIAENPGRYVSISERNREAADNLVHRKLVSVSSKSEITGISLTARGREEAVHASGDEWVESLSKGIISGKGWEGVRFKPYDVGSPVEREYPAIRHPLRRIIDEIKTAYVGMGFSEISGPIVEPSFWVFDSLFVPQDHPAREMQDTFYLSSPERLSVKEREYMKQIGKAHRDSWKGEWEEGIAEQALLRPHMTSVSSRLMHSIIEQIKSGKAEIQLPIKFFTVGRVFRNENLDYKHLADFYQTDGIIIGKDLTVANLFSTLAELYAHIGIKIKFKPAYFPFVEPGVEVFAYSERTKEWLEIGGAGMIRSEITGMPRKRVNVLAWGLGVERDLLLRDQTISSITELYGKGLGWLRQRQVV
jgi:phenylalanyl-tRNA synthetase alpha chain